MSTRFDSTDNVRFPAVAGNNPTGAWTVAAVARKRTVLGASAYGGLLFAHDSAGAARAGLTFVEDYLYAATVDSGNTEWNTFSTDGGAGSSTTDWLLVAVAKGAGTVTPRFHLKNLTAASAWTHEANAGNMVNAPTCTGGTWRVGEVGGGAYLDANVAIVGAWLAALSDAEVEALATNADSVDWVDHAVPPVLCAQFNELVGGVYKDYGTAAQDSSVITGTAIDGATDPPGWTYYSGVTTQTILPDADVTTTGWTATPLWSKVADESDATFITATAA